MMPPKWPITAREADAIAAAIIATPDQIEAIAARFRRSSGTIRRIGWARLPKPCGKENQEDGDQRKMGA